MGYSESAHQNRRQTLMAFLNFVRSRQISWDRLFSLETLKAFQGRVPSITVQRTVKALARYLFEHKRIDKPLRQPYRLPQIYEQFLHYYEQGHQVQPDTLASIRRVLFVFYQYLQKSNLQLSRLSIEQVDAFLGKFLADYSRTTCRLYRTYLRIFLRYLYRPCGILSRDLAPLVVGPPQFDRVKPPKFLRPDEIKELFDELGTKLSTAKELRNYAMVYLAYTLGLRPREISLIRLDDISFVDRELRLPSRKNATPVTLPVPEETLKAIAAYLVGGRPKSSSRRLFLNLKPPFRPATADRVSYYIGKCIRDMGVPASAYWLRHSYAQNLLEAGRSIYEIKEMLGHEHIDSSRKYLSIHTKLMREVLFDETV
jgi:site-specific recombinase XerD